MYQYVPRIIIEGSLKDAVHIRRQARSLEGEGCETIILWDEMWKEVSEDYYAMMFAFQPDDIIHVTTSPLEIWRKYEFERRSHV